MLAIHVYKLESWHCTLMCVHMAEMGLGLAHCVTHSFVRGLKRQFDGSLQVHTIQYSPEFA